MRIVVESLDNLHVDVTENGSLKSSFPLKHLLEQREGLAVQLNYADTRKRALEEENSALRSRIKDAECGKSCFTTIHELQEQLRVARLECVPHHCVHAAELNGLKKESQGWRDTAYRRQAQVNELSKELGRVKCDPSCCPSCYQTINRLRTELSKTYTKLGEAITGIDRLKGMPSLSGWRLIETAPKDEFRFILICGDNAMKEARTASWRKGAWHSACMACTYNPTHWMPLPEPPK